MQEFRSVWACSQGLYCCAILFASFPALAAEPTVNNAPYIPRIAGASDEGELAMKGLRLPPGFKVELFAAEPSLANPVAFCIDEKGRFYVCETFRLHDGVTDIRGKNDWLDEDLASRNVSDRLAMLKRHLGSGISDYAIHSDRIRLIEDRDGDGKADHATVFADGFNNFLDGIGAGVLARNGNVWFANIPNLWFLRDSNGDGVADERRSLHYGFGIRIGFLGHDLHGLRFGPDGKLYFSIGDRGSAIKTDGKTIGCADTGCVFRCNPDGSELEVFAFGLRNPQELAFDEYGNLFTGDNNSDSGDKARFVYLVEGGDSGWRIGFQFLDAPYSRGPWNAEKLWYPQWTGQAANIVPPITNIADGPSGLTYYPGTGMPDTYRGHFFLCDFRGGRGSSIHSFAVVPKGASFELTDAQKFVGDCLPTDVDFGTEGGIYFSDWVQGWNKTGKGRIYHVFEPESAKQSAVAETKKLRSEGMHQRSPDDLARLLAHPDMRVRQEAQFALADRGPSAIKIFAEVAQNSSNRMARLHAIWGLGQINSKFKVASATAASHNTAAAVEPLLKLLIDTEPEVRAQAAKGLGDARAGQAFDQLVNLLRDPAPRVRFFAAMSLGKLGRTEAIAPILAMLRENADVDPYLRHAGVMGLTWIHDVNALLAAANDSSPSVRMGILLALRRLERPEISRFLNDPDPALVLEAARAINDQPIAGAVPELARIITRENLPEPLLRRVINANFRFGTPETAENLAQFAKVESAPASQRADALLALAEWATPSGRDRVTGVWNAIPSKRDARTAKNAVQPVLATLLRESPDDVRVAAIHAAEQLAINESDLSLFELALDTRVSARVRAESLRVLGTLQSPRLREAVERASTDSQSLVRREAIRLQAKLQPTGAIAQLTSILDHGSMVERQGAFETLGTLNDPAADRLLDVWMIKLLLGDVPGPLQLDLLEAAAKRSFPNLKERLSKFESALKPDDSLAPFRIALEGGDAQAGKKVFVERAEVACLKCHKINGEGGEVGPDLTGLGSRQKRDYILESILFPNRQIAPGFESVIVTLKNGASYAGVLKSENDKELIVNSPEDGLVTIAKADIKSRNRGLSPMPEGIDKILSKRDLRNLVEFLAEAK